MRALIIEDDFNIADIVGRILSEERFIVDIVHDGITGVDRACSNEYDLIILDNRLPKKQGPTVCKEIRDAGKVMPIIALSALSDIDDKVTLLDAGADDYLTKPFATKELLARVHAVLRRPQELEERVLTIGDITLDVDRHLVIRAKKNIHLTHKEFGILEYLMRNKDMVLSKEQIMEHVWGMPHDPESNTIETHMLSLRRKIGSKGPKKVLYTVSGKGYKFMLPETKVHK